MLRILLVTIFFGVSSVCPVRVGDSRIVEGKEITIEDSPWVVSVQREGLHWCGGTIVSPDAILTAAHCVIGATTDMITVVIGKSDLKGEGGVSASVSKITQHPNFSSVNLDNNLAILRLTNKLTYTDQIQPIPLASSEEDGPTGTPGTLSGWGARSEYTNNMDTLQSTTVTIQDFEICQEIYPYISTSVFCANDLETGNDACVGDYGGPLVARGKLIGVLAWIYECGNIQRPAVYSKISAYYSWIMSLIE